MSVGRKTDACCGEEAWRIVSLHPSEDGACLYLRIRCDATRAGEQLCLRVEEYAALPFKPCKDRPLTDEELTQLRDAAQASTAYRRGVNILGYGANSSRTLQKKLQQKGYDADVAARAVDALSARGYLCEERDACCLARQIMRRGRGMRRILQELRARGYGEKAIKAAEKELADEDFCELCYLVASKKNAQLPTDRVGKQKLLNFLVRNGFEMVDIRAAIRKIAQDE